jgi:DNA-binding NarL/FixJ family response regulator
MLSILIVEDDPDHAARFVAMVKGVSQFSLVGLAETAAEGVRLVESTKPNVLLCDLGLPDGSGLDVIRHTRRVLPETDICVITVFGDEAHVLASIEAGATGYLLKDALPAQFEQTILDLAAGGSPISPVIARQLLRRLLPAGVQSGLASGGAAGGVASALVGAQPAHPQPTPEDAELLSPRELEVLQGIAKGFSYQEIADIHGIKVNTVTSHVKNIYRKLEVHSRGQAVFEAGQRGLIRIT